MSLDYSDMYEHGVKSDCCGAPVVWVDICEDCKEHCTPVDTEEVSVSDVYRDVGMSPGDFKSD